ncbi:MAG: hypothetical protein AB7T49_17540 [Oligoflexales bacterium]
MKIFLVLLTGFVLVSIGCKGRGPNSKIKELAADGFCQLIGQDEIDDPIAKIASANCNTNVEKMLYDAGCSSDGRALIAENNFAHGARTIDVFNCSAEGSSPNLGRGGAPNADNQIFFSHPDEMLTFSHKTHVINFYKYEEGNLHFKGNSFSPDNPCKKCHVMGGMVMKELSAPWVNWLNGRGGDDSPVDLTLLGTDSKGVQRKLFEPPLMEAAVRTAAFNVAEAYKKSVVSGSPTLPNQTLQDVLKPLFCTVEINLANTVMPEGGSEVDHLQFAITPLYLDFLSRSGMGGTPTLAPSPGLEKVKAYFAAHNLSSKNYFAIVPEEGGTPLTFIQNYIMSMDISSPPFLEERLFAAIRLIDYPNHIFSKRRCGLWKQVPATPMSSLKTAADITKAVTNAFASSSDADAKEFVRYIAKSDPNLPPGGHFRIVGQKGEQLATACAQPGSAIQDIDKLYRLFRARLVPLLQEKPLKYFDRIHVVEHFPGNENSPSKMFPEYQDIIDGKYADEEGLGLNEKCDLVRF